MLEFKRDLKFPYSVFVILSMTTLHLPLAAKENCPQIAPTALRVEDSPAIIYDHYIKPLYEATSIGNSIILPTDYAGKAAFLSRLEQQYATYDQATAIYLVNSIKQNYATSSLESLNTEAVFQELKSYKFDRTAQRLLDSAMCVAPSSKSPVTFEINFYGLKEADCKKMLRLFSPATSPDGILVNKEVGGKCLPNGIGKNRSRNQVTFQYLKGKP